MLATEVGADSHPADSIDNKSNTYSFGGKRRGGLFVSYREPLQRSTVVLPFKVQRRWDDIVWRSFHSRLACKFVNPADLVLKFNSAFSLISLHS